MERSLALLREMQALPLEIKVRKAQERIKEWVEYYGKDGVYVSFSGGKDSTLLLHLVREMYPDIPAVFCDTGLEYPEIRDFVKTIDNVTWVKPKMTFRQVIEKYGYPFIGKEVSASLYYARRYIREKGITDIDSADLSDAPTDLKIILGRKEFQKEGMDFPEISRMYDRSRWKFMLDAPFEVCDRCCYVMKKAPMAKYQKETGRVPMLGMTAAESRVRANQWIKNGCNAFDKWHTVSNPLMLWTEEDILYYIWDNRIQISFAYGYIYKAGEVPIDDEEASDTEEPKMKSIIRLSGLDRTGCMFCGFGCHRERAKPRFSLMKETHPKQYEYIMKPWDEGGLGYKEIIDWMNEHGKLYIEY